MKNISITKITIISILILNLLNLEINAQEPTLSDSAKLNAQHNYQRNDVALVKRACEILKEYGVEFECVKNIVFLNSKEDTVEKTKLFPNKESVLCAVAFTEFGKLPIFVNTWDIKLWRNLATEKIVDPQMKKAAAVIAASIIIHEKYHSNEPRKALENLSEKEIQARLYESEVGALKEELKLLRFFRERGTNFLDVPIEETSANIADFTNLYVATK